MKPIRLAFEGLGSYQRRAEIDFSSLCANGLFGIFGPTGSGKSTVLDAMTIALYGAAPRMGRQSLSPLINTQSKWMEVDFTFSLDGGGEVYRAVRRFTPPRGKSPGRQDCRLIRVGTEEIVLTDKQRGMDRLLQELLGLSLEDFRRAVMLPQGEFASFLRLGGKERTEMIERLFGLEPYGRELSAKAKSALDFWSAKAAQLQAQLGELGDCSQERLAQLQNALTLAQGECDALDGQYAQAAKDWERGQALYQNVLRLKSAQAGAEQAETRLEEARQNAQQILKELEQQEEPLLSRQEDLRARLSSLSALLPSARQYDGRWADLAAMEEELAHLESAIRSLGNRDREASRLLEEKRARADALEQSAAGLQIPYGDQERILRGRALQQQWRDVQEQVKQAEADLSAALQNLNEAAGQQDRARAGLIQREAAVRAAQAALEEHLALLDRQRQENAAASLSALLHEGEPCPVCGSRHHPQPAPPAQNQLADIRTALQKALRAREDELEESRKSAASSASAAAERSALCRAAQEGLDRARTLCAQSEEQFLKLAGECGVMDFEERAGLYAERQRELEATQKEIAAVKVSLQELTAGSEAANRALQDCRSKRDALLSKREFLRQSIKQLESLLAEGGFALLPGGTAEAAAQTQTALVKSLDSCAGRLESLRRSRERAEQQIQAAAEAHARAQGALAQARGTLSGGAVTEEELSGLQTRFQALESERGQAHQALGQIQAQYEEIQVRHRRSLVLGSILEQAQKQQGLVSQIHAMLRGCLLYTSDAADD